MISKCINIGILCLAALMAFILAVALPAQEKETKQLPEKKKEVATIDGEGIQVRMNNGFQIATIKRNVVIKHRDTTITADHGVYDEEKETVVLTGNLKIVDPENEITGAKGMAYLKDRKSIVEGDVKLIARPKSADPAKKDDSVRAKIKDPATITCERLEYLYKKKIATVAGSLKITQKGRTLVGDKGVYDVNQELVTLTGGVKVTDEKGQTFSSPGTVKVSTREGAEWIEAEKGSASLKVNLEEELDEPEEQEEKTEAKEQPKQ